MCCPASCGAVPEGRRRPFGRLRTPQPHGRLRRVKLRLLLVLLLSSFPLAAADPLAAAWDHFYNLEYGRAIPLFEQAAAAHPAEPAYRNYLAQAILYQELYRLGVLESELLTGNNYFFRGEKMQPDPAANQRFLMAVLQARELAQARRQADPADLEALYALGSSYGLLANYEFMIQKNWKAAVNHGAEARRRHRMVLQADPNYHDAKLIQGVYDYVIGSLPWHTRFLAYLVGRSGDKNRGIRTIVEVSQNGKANRVDAQVMLAIIYRREKQPAYAIQVLEPLIRDYSRNYLFQMEKAHMHSDLGEKEAALAILRGLEKRALSGRREYANIPLEKVYYAIGNVQFWYNDLHDALAHLRRTTAYRELDLHTGVLAWMRQGQILDLLGQREEARRAYERAIEFAPGTAAAQESRQYLRSPYRRKG